MQNRENVKGIAARAAMWSARHRTLAILAWVAFVVLVTVFGGRFGTDTASNVDQGHGESQRADRIVDAAGFPVQPAGEMVIVQNRAGQGPEGCDHRGDRRPQEDERRIRHQAGDHLGRRAFLADQLQPVPATRTPPRTGCSRP